ALLLATAMRFLHWDALVAYLDQPGAVFRLTLPLIACELALYYHDVYNPQSVQRMTDLLVRLLQGLGTACLALAVLYFTDPGHSLGRGIAVLAAPIILVLLLGWRIILGHKGLHIGEPSRVLMVGTGAPGIALVREIITRPELNLKVVGFLD